MTYDDCEAFEAQQASERAGRLYTQWQRARALLDARLDDPHQSFADTEQYLRLQRRLEAVASRLRFMEEALMERETFRVAPIVRELGEIRRALEGTGDTNRTEAS